MSIDNLQDPFYGVLGDKVRPDDNVVGASGMLNFITGLWDWTKLLRANSSYWNNKTEYQQTEISNNSCTVHGAMGAVSDLTGIIFTETEREHIWNLALQAGASDNWGWYVADAVHLVRDWVAENKGIELTVNRVSLKSSYSIRAMEKGYSLVVAFRGNANYTKDKNDGVLDEENLTGSSTYAHCLRLSLKDRVPYIIDNYTKTAPHNSYIVKNLRKLVNNKVFFENSYFFTLN